jgi:hypothetical protein
VHVVQEDDTRAPVPQRAEERHAVPDLDEHVTGAGAPEQLGHRRPGEHHVAAGAADDLVAIAHVLDRLALGPRGAHGDLDACGRPQLRHLGDVQLGTAGLDVVEVAPREDVDAADARRGGEVSDFRHGVGEVVHDVAHVLTFLPQARWGSD